MSSNTYNRFIKELCALCQLAPSGDFYDNTNLVIDGVNFSLFECKASETGIAGYFCDAGPIDQGKIESASRQALIANLAWFTGFSPGFAIDPDMQRFVLTGRLNISASVIENLILLGRVAHLSRQWQADQEMPDLALGRSGIVRRHHRTATRSVPERSKA